MNMVLMGSRTRKRHWYTFRDRALISYFGAVIAPWGGQQAAIAAGIPIERLPPSHVLDVIPEVFMPENFLLSASEVPDLALGASIKEGRPDREALRLLLIGSRQGVMGTIQTLHRLRFAEVGEWSPLLPGPNPGEVMSILTRYVAVA